MGFQKYQHSVGIEPFVLEILNIERRESGELSSWSFYDLQKKLECKASMNKQKVLLVSPEYTSQRCPICGRIEKTARNRQLRLYTCECGYTNDDDINEEINIRELGMKYLQGQKNPRFAKP